MASHTMLAGMKFSITGTPNSHDPFVYLYVCVFVCLSELSKLKRSAVRMLTDGRTLLTLPIL